MFFIYLCLTLHIYSFFLFFPLNIFVSFIFIALFSNWHLALVLVSGLCSNQFCSDRYNFWFPLFARSIYCSLFLLDCFDFTYGHIRVYSVIRSIVITNLCLYDGLFQFYGVFLSIFSFFLSSSFFFSFLFFIILIFNFLNLSYVSTLIPSFAFPIVLFPSQLIFYVFKSSSATSI